MAPIDQSCCTPIWGFSDPGLFNIPSISVPGFFPWSWYVRMRLSIGNRNSLLALVIFFYILYGVSDGEICGWGIIVIVIRFGITISRNIFCGSAVLIWRGLKLRCFDLCCVGSMVAQGSECRIHPRPQASESLRELAKAKGNNMILPVSFHYLFFSYVFYQGWPWWYLLSSPARRRSERCNYGIWERLMSLDFLMCTRLYRMYWCDKMSVAWESSNYACWNEDHIIRALRSFQLAAGPYAISQEACSRRSRYVSGGTECDTTCVCASPSARFKKSHFYHLKEISFWEKL